MVKPTALPLPYVYDVDDDVDEIARHKPSILQKNERSHGTDEEPDDYTESTLPTDHPADFDSMRISQQPFHHNSNNLNYFDSHGCPKQKIII